MRIRRRAAALVLLTAATAGWTLLLAPAAQATVGTMAGGCYADTVQDTLVTNGNDQGVIGDLSATLDANHEPVFADVSCWIEVDGVERPGTRIETVGTGYQEDFVQIEYEASPTDDVELCQSVDAGTPTCLPKVEQVFIPQPVVAAAT